MGAAPGAKSSNRAARRHAQWNTITVSLIASCQMHGIEPWAYLRDLLTLLLSWPRTRVLELAPKN